MGLPTRLSPSQAKRVWFDRRGRMRAFLECDTTPYSIPEDLGRAFIPLLFTRVYLLICFLLLVSPSYLYARLPTSPFGCQTDGRARRVDRTSISIVPEASSRGYNKPQQLWYSIKHVTIGVVCADRGPDV